MQCIGVALLQCVSKKSLHFFKVPHINIAKYFQEIFIHVGSYGSLLSNDSNKSWRYFMLEWAGATFVKLTKIQAWQELVFILAAISKLESRSWKGFEFFIFRWSDDNLWTGISFVVCIFWHMPSTFYASSSKSFLYWAFDYFLVYPVINAFIT